MLIKNEGKVLGIGSWNNHQKLIHKPLKYKCEIMLQQNIVRIKLVMKVTTICWSNIIHYKKSQFFRMFNLTNVFTLTKKMFTFNKGMGHEKHMVLLIEVTILTKC